MNQISNQNHQIHNQNNQNTCNIYQYRGEGQHSAAPPPYVGVYGMYVACILITLILYFIILIMCLITLTWFFISWIYSQSCWFVVWSFLSTSWYRLICHLIYVLAHCRIIKSYRTGVGWRLKIWNQFRRLVSDFLRCVALLHVCGPETTSWRGHSE